MARPSKRLLSEDDVTQPGPLKDAFNSITPASIGAPDIEQVSGAIGTNDALPFGPDESFSAGAAISLTYDVADAANEFARGHADRHAAGGADPVTPESIGAAPGTFGIYSGHADDAPEGFCYVSSGNLTAANGYPPMPGDDVGYLSTVRHHTNVYLMQRLNGQSGVGTEYVRTKRGAGDWNPWGLVKFDSGPRSLTLENGWTGKVTLSREGGTVFLDVTGANGTAATSDTLVTIPPGFRPRGYKGLIASRGTGAGTQGLFVCQLQSIWAGGALRCPSTETNVYLSTSWPTDEDPTETYPGTPA